MISLPQDDQRCFNVKKEDEEDKENLKNLNSKYSKLDQRDLEYNENIFNQLSREPVRDLQNNPDQQNSNLKSLIQSFIKNQDASSNESELIQLRKMSQKKLDQGKTEETVKWNNYFKDFNEEQILSRELEIVDIFDHKNDIKCVQFSDEKLSSLLNNQQIYYQSSQIYRKGDKIQMIVQYVTVYNRNEKKVILFLVLHIINYERYEIKFLKKLLLDVIPAENLQDQDIMEYINLNGVIVNDCNLYFFKKYTNGNQQTFKLFKLTVDLKKQKFKEEYLQQYSIDLPQDFPIKMEDCTINFFQFIGQHYCHEDDEDKFLKNKYVIIQSNNGQNSLFYKLSNVQNNVDFGDDKDIGQLKYNLGFQKEIDDTTDVLTLFSKKKILKDQELKDDYWINEYAFSKNKFVGYNQCKLLDSFWFCNQNIEPLSLQICIDGEEWKNQYYFITKKGSVQLVYPFYTDSNEILKINQYIQDYFKITGDKIVFTIYYQENTLYSNRKIDNKRQYDYIISIKEMFIGLKEYQQNEDNRPDILFFQDAIKSDKLQEIIDQDNSVLQKEILKSYNQIKDNKGQQINDQIESIYINKNKKNLFSTHNKVFIQKDQYTFNEKYLLIDLGSDQNPFKLLKLYPDEVKNVKLVKYHTTQNCVIFFFLINQEKKGVHFFIIYRIQSIQIQSINDKFTLLDDKSIIYIPIQLKNIVKCQFKDVGKYLARSKSHINSGTDIVFEIVRDLGDPTNQFLPFIYNEWIDYQETHGDVFEHYLCFFNVEGLKNSSMYQDEDLNKNNQVNDNYNKLPNENIDTQIEFNQYIQAFKNQFFQKQNENQILKNLTHKNQGYRQNVQSLNRRSQNLFSRSSNWFSNNGQYQAKFQIGNNLKFDEFQAIELKEFLITIDLDKNIYCNKDQVVFNNQMEQPYHLNSQIKVTPFRIDFLSYSQIYQQTMIKNNKINHEIENNRLVPQIDDDGKIMSTYLLIFNFISKKNINDIIEIINIYDIINSNYNQNKSEMENNLCNIRINKYKFREENDFIHQSSVELKEQSIQNQYLNNIQCYQLLYKYQKQTLTMSMSSFFQSLFLKQLKPFLQSNYFQPFELFQGKALCSFDIDNDLIKNPQHFRKYLNQQEEKDAPYQYLYGSILEDILDLNESIESVVKNLDISQYFEFTYDFVNQVYLVEKLIYSHKILEAKSIIDFMINKGNGQCNLSVNLLQILQSQQLNINQFLNFSDSYLDLQVEEKQEQQNKLFLEQFLLDYRLPPFGYIKQQYTLLDNNKGVSFLLEDIIEEVQNENKGSILEQKGENWNPKEIKQVQHTFISFEEMVLKMKIDMIIKNNSKKASNEGYEKTSDYDKYLKFVQSDIKNFNGVNDLIISKIFKVQDEDQNIEEQKTVQKIIDYQFSKTKKWAKYMFYFYLIGFFLPFIFNVIQADEINKSQYQKVFNSFLKTICGITQLTFFVFELSEIWFNRLKQYFQDKWNIFDFFQPFIYLSILFFSYRIDANKGNKDDQLTFKALMILMILSGSTKLLQLYRYEESFCVFAETFIHVFFELFPFFLIFFVFTFQFTLILIVMDTTNGNDEELKGVTNQMRAFIQTFRTQIGDLQIPEFEGENQSTLQIIILWISWFFNILTMSVIMFNLLIAEVGAIYDRAQSQRIATIYHTKSHINQLIFQIQYFFGYNQQFDMIVIQQPIEHHSDSYDQQEDALNELQSLKSCISQLQESHQKSINELKEASQEILSSINKQ